MTNIFVGNLSYETSQEDLEAAFNEFGAVERVNIVRDRDTGQPRGFAFVEMTNRNEASNAIAGLNGRNMNGRDINVNEARPREERSGGGAGRPGGGGGGRAGGGGGGRPGGGGGGGFNRGRSKGPRW
jgi:RNA recognition motif-containing protein